MSFPRYAEYRESGVDWIGVLPRHWQVAPLKYVAEFRSGGTPDKGRREFWDGDVPWASAKDLKTTNLLDTIDHLTDEAINAGAASVIDPGTVLVVVRGMILARLFPVVRACVAMAINQDLKAVIAKPGMHSDYLAWLLRGSERETLSRLDEAGHGTKALRMDLWTSMQLPLPPADEQVAWTAFLDRETAKIDALVEAQKRLIELLKEKRQAVISQAVTKGLDPNVPMKDSGVEWLGEVPGHWEVMALKRHTELITSGARGWAENYSEEGEVFLRIGNLTRDAIRLDLSEIQRVVVPASAETERTRALPGDLLFSITAYLGSVAVIPEDLEPAYVSQHIALVRLKGSRLMPEWAAYVAASVVGKTFLETQGYGGTKIQLELADVGNLLMLVPPPEEQRSIVEFIERETSRIDELIYAATSAMQLLQERRSALISAAVTGKIDVRGLVSQPEPAAA